MQFDAFLGKMQAEVVREDVDALTIIEARTGISPVFNAVSMEIDRSGGAVARHCERFGTGDVGR